MRSLLRAAAMAVYLALAPSTIPPWRADPSVRTAIVLAIGEPTPLLHAPRERQRGFFRSEKALTKVAPE